MLIFCFIASVKKSLQKRRVVIDKEEQGMYRSINDNNKIEVSSIVCLLELDGFVSSSSSISAFLLTFSPSQITAIIVAISS